jgi:hypothetical protein
MNVFTLTLKPLTDVRYPLNHYDSFITNFTAQSREGKGGKEDLVRGRGLYATDSRRQATEDDLVRPAPGMRWTGRAGGERAHGGRASAGPGITVWDCSRAWYIINHTGILRRRFPARCATRTVESARQLFRVAEMVDSRRSLVFYTIILLAQTAENSDLHIHRELLQLKLAKRSTDAIGSQEVSGGYFERLSLRNDWSEVLNHRSRHDSGFTRLRGGQPAQAPPNGPQSVQLGVLRNLLDWSTSITNTSESSNQTKLDPERIRWLQEAMHSLLENTTDVFRQSIEVLQDPELEAESIERKEQALETIRERVDHLDLAVGLDNMGGLRPTINCLESVHSSIRWRAADVVAVAVINHEKLQQVDSRYSTYS